MLQPTTLTFLRELKANNNKDWFDQNRKRYEMLKGDYLALAEQLLNAMKKEDSSLEMLSPKDCIFRINRDIRFSKNKAPYKTNLGIALHTGGKKSQSAAYYLHIEEGLAFVGGGLWMPEPQQLHKVRKEIHYFYDEFSSIIQNASFKNIYGSLDVEEGQKLTRPPKGYEINDPAIEYLKLKSFTAIHTLPDTLLTSTQLVPTIVESFKVLKPMIHFINRGLQSDANGGL
jgi:uncharacterized protein (TIGR02453 family)